MFLVKMSHDNQKSNLSNSPSSKGPGKLVTLNNIHLSNDKKI